MYIFDMCNDVHHIGRIGYDRLRHEPNREQRYFPHYAVQKFMTYVIRRSQWPRGLRRRSTAARLLRLWARIPPGARMFGLL